MSQNKEKRILKDELIFNNPVFGMYLGICSVLAITNNINNALGMGVSVIVVLVLSNVLVSLIARITPEEIHIPVYIIIIASLVSVVGMVMHAYTPELYSALGTFIDLIVVNCIILGRAEAYACKHNVVDSLVDGLIMGLAYTLAVFAMAFIRQILGTGVLSLSNPFNDVELFAIRLIPAGFEIPVFTSQTGSFLTFAMLAAWVANKKNIAEELAAKKEREAKIAKAKALKAAQAKGVK